MGNSSPHHFHFFGNPRATPPGLTPFSVKWLALVSPLMNLEKPTLKNSWFPWPYVKLTSRDLAGFQGVELYKPVHNLLIF